MKNLIIVCGLPVAGKSTLAEQLSKELNLTLLSVDPIESSIIKAGISRSFKTGLAAYIAAETISDENLRLGNSVIIDAVSGVPEAKKMWRDLSKKHQAKLIIVECICSDEATHKQRTDARTRNIYGMAEVTWEDVLKRKSEYVAWDEPVLTIDSIDQPEANLTKVLDYISKQR